MTKQEFINSSIYKNLDQNSKEFIDELPEDAVILLQSIAISTDKNSAAGLGNGNITIGYVSKELGGRVDDIALKYQPNEINAEYDAELAALKSENKPIASEQKNSLPKIETTSRDSKLFNDIASALSVTGQKNKQIAIENLYAGKKAKYSKEEVDAAISINKDFEKIIADMQRDGVLTKQC